MKRIIAALLGAVILVMPSFAKTGDVCGSIYATDIKAIINGVEVPSYNIGGRTVVIIEDITHNHSYNDELRAFIIGELSPGALIAGSNKSNRRPGTKIGNIYETDIVTYTRGGEQLPCYSLNGRMAVAIEDLGWDNTFNLCGGRYFWDEEAGTIELEYIHFEGQNVSAVLKEKSVNMTIDENYNATFESAPIANGSVSGMRVPANSFPQPIMAEGVVVGYAYKPDNIGFLQDANGNVQLTTSDGIVYNYFYKDRLAEVLADVEVIPPSREDWIEYYKTHQWMDFVDYFETEEYTFIHGSQPNFHGSTRSLIRISKDGGVIEYGSRLESVSLHGNKYFDKLVIDRENETVTFRYDVDYIIDLKTGEMKAK